MPPGQDVHAGAAEGAVGVGLGAVQHLLQLLVPRLLGLDPDLEGQEGGHCVTLHDIHLNLT